MDQSVTPSDQALHTRRIVALVSVLALLTVIVIAVVGGASRAEAGAVAVTAGLLSILWRGSLADSFVEHAPEPLLRWTPWNADPIGYFMGGVGLIIVGVAWLVSR